jgi:hypothetical protein
VLTIDLYQHKDIYMIIIIVLKPYSRLTQSKAQATSRDGQLGLIQNKIRIKMIIIIVLKTGSVIDLE